MKLEKRVELVADLYERVATALNEFYAKSIGDSCTDCLALCAEHNPADPIADMELVSGVFPGCCQAGVADDFQGLPESLVKAIKARRPLPPGSESIVFTLRDRNTGTQRFGRGCIWLGDDGCMLGSHKSVMCLSYLCRPVQERLCEVTGDTDWVFEDDFCGMSKVFTLLGGATLEGGKTLIKAEQSVNMMIQQLSDYFAQLK